MHRCAAVSATAETIAHPVAMAVDIEVRIVHNCVHECELNRISSRDEGPRYSGTALVAMNCSSLVAVGPM